MAFDEILRQSEDNRDYLRSMGKDILEILLNHSLRVTICVMHTSCAFDPFPGLGYD